MKRQLLQLLLAGLMLVTVNAAFGQGTTTSSINGRVTDTSGETLPGATVLAVHTPSGSRYGNITNSDGFYRIPNMRVGGPYTVTVTFIGYKEFKRENVYLTLGQAFKINAELTETSVSLDAVEVVADRNSVFDGNRTGSETVVGLEQINSTPTVARAIGDFARFTPQATIEEGNDGFSISIGGQNNRLNSIYIDGAVNIAAATTIATDNKIQFRDTAIHISSSADGQLDLVADTEIQIAATTIDINGAINASGEIIAASLDISGGVDVDGTLETDALSIASTTVTSTAAELNFSDGVTSNIQTQLDTKATTGKAIAMALVFG